MKNDAQFQTFVAAMAIKSHKFAAVKHCQRANGVYCSVTLYCFPPVSCAAVTDSLRLARGLALNPSNRAPLIYILQSPI